MPRRYVCMCVRACRILAPGNNQDDTVTDTDINRHTRDRKYVQTGKPIF